MFSRTGNCPVLVYIRINWLVDEDRQPVVADDKMESSEYSYSGQLKNHIQLAWVQISLWPVANHSLETQSTTS